MREKRRGEKKRKKKKKKKGGGGGVVPALAVSADLLMAIDPISVCRPIPLPPPCPASSFFSFFSSSSSPSSQSVLHVLPRSFCPLSFLLHRQLECRVGFLHVPVLSLHVRHPVKTQFSGHVGIFAASRCSSVLRVQIYRRLFLQSVSH